MSKIEFYNTLTNKMEVEQIYGEPFLRFLYNSPLGAIPLHLLIKRAAFSKWYGWRMNQAKTRSKILPFIEKYGLDASEFYSNPTDYANFNEFFYRKLKSTARPIEPAANFVFPADGRHLAFPDISEIHSFFVKNQSFDLAALLGKPGAHWVKHYERGSLLLSRLCPTDYHRFHFPCDGVPGPTQEIPGPLFSVSPLALRRQLRYLWTNKRTLTELRTKDFGTVLLCEIGATCVGSIHQSYTAENEVKKGDEKGYFSFGGSSVITIFEPGMVKFSASLLSHTAQQIESYALMGGNLE